MKQIRRLAAILPLLGLLLGLSACSSEDPGSKRTPPSKIQDSLKPDVADPLNMNQQGGLILKKKSLGKAFLMSSTMTIAWSAPILDHLQPVVVSFERHGDELALFELNPLAYYKDLPSEKILQRFKIDRETPEDIHFKWSYGLEFVSGKGLSYYSDMPEYVQDATSPNEIVYPTVTTFVRGISIDGGDLKITQVSRLRDSSVALTLPGLQAGLPADVNVRDMTVSLDFRIRPYLPSQDFQAKESEFAAGLGFFEQISWNRQEKRAVVQAMRWDMSPARGPIVFAITRNVPPEYVDAVAEGVLYWNKVVGREVLKVEKGADPRERASDRRVLVHWIDWDDAGFARASLQADPLTGELITGNVYMTSVFAIGARMSARQELASRPSLVIKPAGLPAATVCSQAAGFHFAETIPAGATEAVLLKAAQDQVRVTMAHEVGHTLGLRHNFAGSMHGEISTFEQAKSILKEYYQGLTTKLRLSSSVMDYQGYLSGVLGDQIKTRALDYDVAALAWSNDPALKAQDLPGRPLFCTDGHAYNLQLGRLFGCEIWDESSQPLAFRTGMAVEARQNISIRMARSLIMSLHPANPARKVSAQELLRRANAMNLDERVKRVATYFSGIALFLSSDVRHISVVKEMGESGWLNQEQWKESNDVSMKKAFASMGGLSGLYQSALPFDAGGGLAKGWLSKQMAGVLELPELRAGVTLEGVKYELTAEEREVLSRVLTAFAKAFEEKYVLGVIGYLSINPALKKVFATENLPAEDAIKLPSMGSAVVLQSDAQVPVKVGERVIEVPSAVHSAEVRVAMLGLLSPKAFGDEAWAVEARGELKKRLVARIQSLGASGDSAAALTVSLKALALSDEAKEWVGGELAVLKAVEALAP